MNATLDPAPREPVEYRFGEFCLLLPEQILQYRGERVENVQQQTIAVISHLVRNAGRTVGKNELIDAVWEHSHLTDSAVARAILKARQALGDDGQSQSMIRTIHGQGFQFVAPVSEKKRDATSARPSRWKWVLAIAVLLVVAAGWLLWNPIDIKADKDTSNNVQAAPLAGTSFAIDSFVNRTGESGHDWFEHGGRDGVGQMLNDVYGASWQTVPEDEAPRSTVEKQRYIGADYLLQGEYTSDVQGYRFIYSLTPAGGESIAGTIEKPELPLLLRAVTEAVVGHVSGDQAVQVALPKRYSDPLVAELYARAREAYYQDDHVATEQFLEAAVEIEPGDSELDFRLVEARAAQQTYSDGLTLYLEFLETHNLTSNPGLHIRALEAAGTTAWHAGDISKAYELLSRAKSMLNETNDRFAEGRVLLSLSMTNLSLGNASQAWQEGQLALRRFEQAGDIYHVAEALTNLGYAADDYGQLAQAQTFHQQALKMRKDAGLASAVAASEYALGRVERRMGNFDQAIALVESALETFRNLERDLFVFDCLEELAVIYIEKGEFDRAYQMLEQSRAVARAADDALGLAWADEIEGRGRAGQEQWDQAVALLKKSEAEQIELGEKKEAALAAAWLVVALASNGEPGVALSKWQEYEELRDQLPTDFRIALSWSRASIAMHSDIDNAGTWFEQSLELARQVGAKDREARIAADYATFLHDNNGSTETIEVLQQTVMSWSAESAIARQLTAKLSAQ